MSLYGCASWPIIVGVRGLAWISLAVILSLHIRDFRALWGECGVSLIQAEAAFPPPYSLRVLMPMAAYRGQAWKTEYCCSRRMRWRILSVCFQTILEKVHRAYRQLKASALMKLKCWHEQSTLKYVNKNIIIGVHIIFTLNFQLPFLCNYLLIFYGENIKKLNPSRFTNHTLCNSNSLFGISPIICIIKAILTSAKEAQKCNKPQMSITCIELRIFLWFQLQRLQYTKRYSIGCHLKKRKEGEKGGK